MTISHLSEQIKLLMVLFCERSVILAGTGDGTHKNKITRPWHSFDGLGVFIPKIANITKNELTRPRHSTC